MELSVDIPEGMAELDRGHCPRCNHGLGESIKQGEKVTELIVWCDNCSWTGGVWLPRFVISG